MRIEVINSNTIKVILSEYDMSDYDICYERLSHKDPDTKRLLVELLQLVRTEKNIDLCNERIFIEAFPCTDGGCMLYISPLTETAAPVSAPSRVRPKASLHTGLVCETQNVDELAALCGQLHRRFSHIIHESQLYRGEKGYRLVLYVYNRLEEKLMPLLREFGRLDGKGELPCARTREHCTCLVEQGAVETIVKSLC